MHIRRIEKLHRKLLPAFTVCTTHIVKFLNLQGLEIVTMYLVLSCRQIIYQVRLFHGLLGQKLKSSKELENVLTLKVDLLSLIEKPNLP